VRYANLHVAGVGSSLPPRLSIEDAEKAGLCKRQALWRTEFISVCVSERESGPELAATAAVSALAQAGCAPAEVDLVLHADAYYQGHDMWSPASYVQRVALGNRCPAIEVRQMSNGGMAALDLAAGYLTADPARRAALVTTGDRFCRPGFDRWRSDLGTVYADGGTALVLSNQGGFARLHSLVTIGDASLEQMARGDTAFHPAPPVDEWPVDVDVRRRAFVAASGLDSVLDRIDSGQREAIKRVSSEAEVDLADIDWFVLPNLGRSRLNEHFLHKFPIEPERTTWAWGRRVGHLGAGDQIAGLGYLADSGLVRTGQRIMLAGVGAGFSWSCAVLEITGTPPARPAGSS
jgi:3-oxoacyl-[acyl-carrier-protein] synthase-3